MCPPDEGKATGGEDPENHKDSLADQALEAIIRSQQLRERSRKLRKDKDTVEKPPSDPKKPS